MEQVARKRKQRRDLQHAVLSVVSVVGIIALAAVAPQVPGALKKMGMLPGARDMSPVNRARTTLLRKGLLAREGQALRLTPRGEAYLRRLEIQRSMRIRPRHWDGRWRVLIFDIPEKRKQVRAQIRASLMQMGFVHLQHSVWAFPYDCEDFVALLKADLRVGKNLLYMIVDILEGDEALRANFNLA